MEPKSIPKWGRNLGAKKLPLGTALGRFWVVLEGCRRVIFVDFLLVFVLFSRNRRFGRRWVSDSDPGAKKSEKGTPKGGQKGPKRRQKRDQNDIEILIDFLIDFGPILEGAPDPPANQVRGPTDCAGLGWTL